MRRLLTPRWVALHVLAVVAVVVCLRFAAWQWGRAEESGRFQNYAYAIEWAVFAAFAVFMWVKTMVDGVEDAASAERPAGPAPASDPAEQPRLDPAPRPRLGTPVHPRLGTPLQPRLGTPAQDASGEPGQRVEEEPDEELAAYNAYLAQLDAKSRR